MFLSLMKRRRVTMARKKAVSTPGAEEAKVPKKPGRKPMTAEEKMAAGKERAEARKKADNLKPVIQLQYQGSEVDMETLVEAAKADFHQIKKRTLITALTLYVKPEEHIAYYVINGEHEGKIPY